MWGEVGESPQRASLPSFASVPGDSDTVRELVQQIMSGQPYVTIRGREDGVGIRNGAPVCWILLPLLSPLLSLSVVLIEHVYVNVNVNARERIMSSHPVRQGMARDVHARSATHDTSRASFHVKHIGQFAKRLEDVRLTPACSCVVWRETG